MSGEDILGSYWTTAGPADPTGTPPPVGGPQWSPFSWEDRCAHANRVGLRGLGIWHEDLRHLLETHSLGDLGRIFADAGLEHLELEFLMNWYVPEEDPRRAESDAGTRLLFDATAALGARHVKVGNILGIPVGREELVDAFGTLCALAAEEHDAPIVYELMPPDVNVDSLDKAIDLVTGAGARNGGFALDTWHLGKLGITPAMLEALPLEYPLYVELSDGRRENMPSLHEEVTSYRLLPGEGEFELESYVSTLRNLGYHGPWGCEVLSAELRALAIETLFDRIAETTSALLASAAQPVTT
ncbi:MAG: sugar phosphate isomerase/epimerase family protein [Acidimicrobiales bacterium]